jgi:hypothetical protein
MTATLTIDPNGGIPLPLAFLEKFRLKPGAKLLADLSDAGMALRPDDETDSDRAKLVNIDGFMVFTGTEPFDAVEAIMAARADRDEELSALRAR